MRPTIEEPIKKRLGDSTNPQPDDRKSIVVSLFDYTCNLVLPWAEAGYLCYCVDIKHPNGAHRTGNIIRVGADVKTWLPPSLPIKIMFSCPPCTDVAVSGSRWFKDKGLQKLIDALTLFEHSVRMAELRGVPYLIENPVSTVSTYWRKPDYTFDPCDYGGYLIPEGDAYTKRTCLWVGNGFVMPKTKWVLPSEGSRMHKLAPTCERPTIRSATPKGFA